jgi:hypothetical protein
MKKYTNVAIVASFFGLWMDSYCSTKLQIMLGFFLIFTFGILHGANDLLIVNKINLKKPSNSKLKILGYYVIVVLIGLLLFYSIPQIGSPIIYHCKWVPFWRTAMAKFRT